MATQGDFNCTPKSESSDLVSYTSGPVLSLCCPFSHMTLSKVLNLSKLQFLSQQNGDNNSSYLMGLT